MPEGSSLHANLGAKEKKIDCEYLNIIVIVYVLFAIE